MAKGKGLEYETKTKTKTKKTNFNVASQRLADDAKLILKRSRPFNREILSEKKDPLNEESIYLIENKWKG